MSTLHLVNKSPFECSSLKSCVDHLSNGDALLLIEDAVVAAKNSGSAAALLREAMTKASVYVLGPDLAARAIKDADILAGSTPVDYRGFVDLTVRHDRTQSWL